MSSVFHFDFPPGDILALVPGPFDPLCSASDGCIVRQMLLRVSAVTYKTRVSATLPDIPEISGGGVPLFFHVQASLAQCLTAHRLDSAGCAK
ncbi:MAG TPA: hypothetical protein VGP12_08670 [Nitrosospira sp.]|jgi:hypothetical protein|nr:hypothetical protein [Nitrosospira sp.]